MSITCFFGSHAWDGCMCSKCGKTRDEQHDLVEDCDKCSKCGQNRYGQHDWSKDCKKCSKCGKTRDEQHDWSKDCENCSKCGEIRDNQHVLANGRSNCSKCGKAELDIYKRRGHNKQYHDDEAGAVLEYDKAINITQKDANLYLERARLKNVLKDHYGAIKDCNDALKIEPNNYSCYVTRGRVKYDLNDHIGAIDDFDKAIEINPKNGYAYVDRATAKYEIGDFEGSDHDFRKAEEYLTGKNKIIISHTKNLLEMRDLSIRLETGSPRQVFSKNSKPAIEWAYIPADTFSMGSPTFEVERGVNETQHQVTLRAFRMSKFQVTFEQYDLFCHATGRYNRRDDLKGREKLPVTGVSWNDAVAFADWMGCRLPTEAEWEYACRAGTTTPFNTGNNLTTAQANYHGNYPYNHNAKGEYREKTMPVGSFAPNAWGLYDMHGNVWEWCSDWYGYYSTGAQTDPKGPATGTYRVRRGGSNFMKAQFCRAAYRGSSIPDSNNYDLGFRLVAPE